MNAKKYRFPDAHSPIAFLFAALVVVAFCDCAGSPLPKDISGPSGSDMMCAGLLFFNAMLWLPLGILLMFLQRKDRFYSIFNKGLRTIFYAVAVLCLVWAYFLLADESGGITKQDYHIVVMVIVILNYIAAKFFHMFVKTTE